MIKSKAVISRVGRLTLMTAIVAITLVSAPINASSVSPLDAQAITSAPASTNAQTKATAKAAEKAAKLAAKKVKLCAKKSTNKNAQRLAAKQSAAGCFATGNTPEIPGIDPSTLPPLFTQTPGNTNGNNWNDGTGDGETPGVIPAPTAVPEPGTLGLLGMGLLGLGLLRRRKF